VPRCIETCIDHFHRSLDDCTSRMCALDSALNKTTWTADCQEEAREAANKCQSASRACKRLCDDS
jgi:hypothetical protein